MIVTLDLEESLLSLLQTILTTSYLEQLERAKSMESERYDFNLAQRLRDRATATLEIYEAVQDAIACTPDS